MADPSSGGEEGSVGTRRLSPALAALAGLVGVGIALFLSCLFTGAAGAATPPPSLPTGLAATASAVAAPVPTVPTLIGDVTPAVPAAVPSPLQPLATTTVNHVNTVVTSAAGPVGGAVAPGLPTGGLTVPTLSTLSTLTTSVTGIVPAPSIAPAGITHSMPVTGGGSSTGLATALAPVSFLSDRGTPTTTSPSVAQGSTRPRPSGPGAPIPPSRSPTSPVAPTLPPAGSGGSVPTGHGTPFGSLPPHLLVLVLAGAGLLVARRETFTRLLLDVRHAPPG